MPISPRLWLDLEKLTDKDARIVMKFLEQKLEHPQPPQSSVDREVESWGYRGGWFVPELRHTKGRINGPYYYYRYHVEGKQRNLYVGPVAKLTREQAQEIIDRKLDA